MSECVVDSAWSSEVRSYAEGLALAAGKRFDELDEYACKSYLVQARREMLELRIKKAQLPDPAIVNKAAATERVEDWRDDLLAEAMKMLSKCIGDMKAVVGRKSGAKLLRVSIAEAEVVLAHYEAKTGRRL